VFAICFVYISNQQHEISRLCYQTIFIHKLQMSNDDDDDDDDDDDNDDDDVNMII